LPIAFAGFKTQGQDFPTRLDSILPQDILYNLLVILNAHRSTLAIFNEVSHFPEYSLISPRLISTMINLNLELPAILTCSTRYSAAALLSSDC
jgi:hypothetical protein